MWIWLTYSNATTEKYNKTAHEITKENIVKFDDDDVVSVEEVKHKSQYETILHKVLQKENKKKRREERFASIDWQKKRLPKLS